MRSLPLILSAAIASLTLAACDKPAEGDAKVAAADQAKEDAKPEAKKAGEVEQTEAKTEADPEEGCIHDKPEPEAEGEHSCDHGGAPAAAGSTGHFGAPFAVTEAQPLATVLAAELPTDAVKVSGTVEAVCQKKGCWMVIKDGEMSARVLVKDHAFAIPFDGKGKSALVEGTLESKDLSEANVAHLKQDGDDTIEGDGARKEYFLHATSVELNANS